MGGNAVPGCRAAGAVFTPLTPGWEDCCLEGVFLGAISQIQDKDMVGDIRTSLSVSGLSSARPGHSGILLQWGHL